MWQYPRMYSLKTDTNKKPPKATTITTKVNSREKIKKKKLEDQSRKENIQITEVSERDI